MDMGRVTDVPGTRRPRGQTHTGYDIGAPKPPPNYEGSFRIEGSNVYATASGTVRFARSYFDGEKTGLRVHIAHPDGSTTRYYHLADVDLMVTVGTDVEMGSVIGKVGGSGAYGLSDYPIHLHYERYNTILNEYLPPFGDDELNSLFVRDFQWGTGLKI